MTHALNLTLPIKQDAKTLADLQALKDAFPSLQKAIGDTMAKSHILHFARVLVIDDKYIQVITEFEGPFDEYSEFFRLRLTDVFGKIFALAENAPDVEDPVAFFNFARAHQVRSLGNAEDGSPSGWLFSAYNHKTVEQIQDALAKA